MSPSHEQTTILAVIVQVVIFAFNHETALPPHKLRHQAAVPLHSRTATQLYRLTSSLSR